MKTLHLVMCFVSWTQGREHPERFDETGRNKPFHRASDGKLATFFWWGTKYYRRGWFGTKTVPFAGRHEFEKFLRERKDTISIKWPKAIRDQNKYNNRNLEVTTYGPGRGKVVSQAGQRWSHRDGILEHAGEVIKADIFWFRGNKVVGCYKKKGKAKGSCWRRTDAFSTTGYYYYPAQPNWAGCTVGNKNYVECSSPYDCIRDQRVEEWKNCFSWYG